MNFLSPVTLENKERFCFKYKADIPDSGANLPVFIVANGANVPLWNKYGNPVLGKDLNKCRVYCGYYGSSTPHVIFNRIPAVYNCSCSNVL